jgi:CBS domain-containing protein
MKARDVMSAEPAICETSTPMTDAARLMRDKNIGDVLVADDGELCGIVTDRDLVVRGLAEHGDADSVNLGDICSKQLHAVSPDTSVEEIIEIMEQHAVRRVPVLDGDRAVGIVSIGDLAMQRDENSALGRISSAPPNS